MSASVPAHRSFPTSRDRQALERRRVVTIAVAGQRFAVPVPPELLGALDIKARVSASSTHEKHRRDLARLLAVVNDIEAMHAETSPERTASESCAGVRCLEHACYSERPGVDWRV
jgi:hypothetical protein